MKTKNSVFSIKVGGEAGQGQQAVGMMFSKISARNGYYAHFYSEFSSLIRGGHVTSSVSVSDRHVHAAYKRIHLLLALNTDTVRMHIKELEPDGAIIYNSDAIEKNDVKKYVTGRRSAFALPIETMAKQNKLLPLMQNMIVVGASSGLLGIDKKVVNTVVDAVFKKKSAETRKMNKKAVTIGYDYAISNFSPEKYHYRLTPKMNREKKGRAVFDCNEAVALGAVAAGCRAYFHYPMSPSSSILHTLASWEKKTKMAVVQPEDEISGMHMMLGAMNAGTRSMVATSGGGFALMTEGLTLSAMSETPAVLCVCSRSGPATGLPTWTEQGDLKFIVHAGHGDFPRVVLAPSNPQEAYTFTTIAFNIAEKYQIPVFILMDKYTSEGKETYASIETKCTIDRGKLLTDKQVSKMKNYLRYKITKDGVSPRALPGQKGGVHIATSDEHDEYGFSAEGWDEPMRDMQMEKRHKKISSNAPELPRPVLYGPKKAKLTFIGWGSTKGPMIEAMYYLKNVNYIHVFTPFPVQEKLLRPLVSKARRLVAIENNFSGQFASILRAETGMTVSKMLLKYDGRQFYPEEIIEYAKKFL